jgi:hypothetical protein
LFVAGGRGELLLAKAIKCEAWCTIFLSQLLKLKAHLRLIAVVWDWHVERKVFDGVG